MRESIVLREVRESDLDAVLAVQAACYPPVMQEAREVVLARMRAAGASSLVALVDGVVQAYVFAYRSVLGAVTPLGAEFAVAVEGDTLYIHDLSVAPAAAGCGLARGLVARLRALACAQGLAQCALVSVQDSLAFWERLGFRASACVEEEARAALDTYPPIAVYMSGCAAAG